MCVLYRASYFCHQTNDLAGPAGERFTILCKAAARRVLHAKEGEPVVCLTYFVDRQNVWMIKARGCFSFAPETLERVNGVGVIILQALDRYNAARVALPRPVNHTHATTV